MPVEIASSRKLGLSALRRRDYATVIVDESIAEADPAGTDLIWKHSGLAVPLQINFALVGCARLGREVKAALARREQEQSLAMRAATSSLENDLKSTVTGLLLQSELALSEPSVPPAAGQQAEADGRAGGNAAPPPRAAPAISSGSSGKPQSGLHHQPDCGARDAGSRISSRRVICRDLNRPEQLARRRIVALTSRPGALCAQRIQDSAASRADFMYRGAYCAHTGPLPLLPSGPGGVGGIASRRARHNSRISSTAGAEGRGEGQPSLAEIQPPPAPVHQLLKVPFGLVGFAQSVEMPVKLAVPAQRLLDPGRLLQQLHRIVVAMARSIRDARFGQAKIHGHGLLRLAASGRGKP